MLEKLQIYISIVAAIVVTIVCLIEGWPLYILAVRLVIFIISFYIIGLAVKYYLTKKVLAVKSNAQSSGEPAEDETLSMEHNSFFAEDESF